MPRSPASPADQVTPPPPRYRGLLSYQTPPNLPHGFPPPAESPEDAFADAVERQVGPASSPPLRLTNDDDATLLREEPLDEEIGGGGGLGLFGWGMVDFSGEEARIEAAPQPSSPLPVLEEFMQGDSVYEEVSRENTIALIMGERL